MPTPRRWTTLAALSIALVGCSGSQAGDGARADADAVIPPAVSATSAGPSTPPAAPGAYATAKPGAAPCGALTAMKLGTAKPLLAGRLMVRSVEGAGDVPLPYDVMSAPDAPTDRSRVYYERGQVGLAVVATERWQRAGAGYDTAVRRRLEDEGGEVVDVKTGGPALPMVAWLPTEQPSGASGTSFLLVGYVKHPDGTVQFIQIGTFPEQFTDVDGCRALALSIAATLTPGKRALESGAGTRDIAFFDKKFKATVPDGWVVSTQPGPDFVVVRIRELSEFPEPAPELGIALTDHPPSPNKDGVLSTQPGKLLGRPATWDLGQQSNRDNKPVFFARARVTLARDVADAWVNTFVPDARKRALAIADSMVAAP